MKCKFGKFLVGAVSTAAACCGVAYVVKKVLDKDRDIIEEDDDFDDFDEDDFDEVFSDDSKDSREYVTINITDDEAKESVDKAEDSDKEEKAVEEEDKTEESADKTSETCDEEALEE